MNSVRVNKEEIPVRSDHVTPRLPESHYKLYERIVQVEPPIYCWEVKAVQLTSTWVSVVYIPLLGANITDGTISTTAPTVLLYDAGPHPFKLNAETLTTISLL